MLMARGWWMKWCSSGPRRSGAFVVEIVERAPQVRACLACMAIISLSDYCVVEQIERKVG